MPFTHLTPTLDLLPDSDSGLSNSDNVTNASVLLFGGTGTPGDTITLYWNITFSCTGTVNSAGTWALSIDASAFSGDDDAERAFSVRASSGQDYSDWVSMNVTVDHTAPRTPVEPLPDGGTEGDYWTNAGSVTPNGTAIPGATVHLYANAVLLGSTVADEKGHWSYLVADIAEGDFAFTIDQADLAGNASMQSSPLLMRIDRTAPTDLRDVDVAANTVALGAANGTAVGVTVHSPDADVVGYRLLNSADGIFAIDETSGKITLANSAALGATDYTLLVQAIDQIRNVSTKEVTIHAHQPNTPPELNGLAAFSFDEDGKGVIHFNVADGQTAAGQLSVSATSSNPALIGAITLDGSGAERTLSLTPLADANGRAEITVTVSDGTFSTSKTFVATVNAVNDAPIAANDTLAGGNEDQSVRIAVASLLANDKDVDGNALTLTAVSDANGGTVSFDAATQTITFTPRLNYNGAASFNYTVSDGALSSVAKASFTINPVNDAPVAVGDMLAAGVEDRVYTVAAATLLANDSDVDGNPLTLTGVSAGSGGTVSFNAATQMVTFTPTGNYNGAASFNYTVSDGALSSTAKASFSLAPVNDAPSAVNDYLGASNENQVRKISVASLLGNDYDVDGNALTLTSVAGASGGTVSLDVASQTITFKPTANYYGAAGFSYAISDGSLTASARVSFNIDGGDDPAYVRDDYFAMQEDGVLSRPSSELLANDSDSDSRMVIDHVDALVGGPVKLVGGNFVFTPLANFYGHAQFKYTLTDGGVGYVNVNVAQVDDAVNYVNDVQKLYLAYFNRAAEPAGLQHWVNLLKSGLSFNQISEDFTKTVEFTHTYGGMSSMQIVDQAYVNLFGRHAEPEALLGWAGGLNNQTSTVGQFFVNIIRGAQNSDVTTSNNKAMAAEYFTYYLDTPAEQSGYNNSGFKVVHEYLNGVTDEASLFNARLGVHDSIAMATHAPLGTSGANAAMLHSEASDGGSAHQVALTGIAPTEGVLIA
jgi:hypothetical protein